jgi:hypothetical protein
MILVALGLCHDRRAIQINDDLSAGRKTIEKINRDSIAFVAVDDWW